MLTVAARALGDLRNEVVFVGGAIVDLLVTDPAAPPPRFTDDVDVVAEVTTQVEWYALCERLRTLGFREDRRDGAPLCRWLAGDLAVDVMPGKEKVLGFANRWRVGSFPASGAESAAASSPAYLVARASEPPHRSCGSVRSILRSGANQTAATPTRMAMESHGSHDATPTATT